MKNNPFTRFLSVALTVAMLIGVMPGAVLADAGEAIVGASSAVVESIPESTTPEDAAPVATEVPPVTEPEASPEAVVEPEATPEATEQPEATPEATQEPEATPEATEEPEATPEVTQEPEATPEATEEPEATPEAPEKPEATPEPTQEPVELNEEAYTVTAEVADAEGVTVTVKVPANTLPEGVNLVAEMLTEDTQAHADAEAALAEAEVQYDGMIAMDIRFEDAEGNEVEPANEVEVSIDAQALLPEDADPETVAVQHLKEDENGAVTVETVADAAPATGDVTVAENADQAALNMASTFAVDGFSTFTIIWGYISPVDLNVTCVDENGTPLPETANKSITMFRDDVVYLQSSNSDLEIEGYTFVSAHLNRYNGTEIVQLRRNNNKIQYKTSSSSWKNLDSNGVYFVYKSNNPFVETVDSSKNIEIDLFNYSITGNSNINTGRVFQFNSGTAGSDFNRWSGYVVGSLEAVYQDIVAAKGEKAPNNDQWYPVLNQTVTGSSESLAYLFDGTAVTGKTSYTDLNHLFLQSEYDDTGYYVYNSADNFARLNTENRTFDVYAISTTNAAKFMPFNSISGSGALQQEEDFYFGMHIGFQMLQPEDGKVTHNGTTDDMVFRFNGDDDLWVFIDGVLVLDLGGIHGAAEGSINFADGTVSIPKQSNNTNGVSSGIYRDDKHLGNDKWSWWGQETTIKDLMVAAGVDASQFDGNTFADWSSHRVDIYYLERGAGKSNCKMEFNIQTIPQGTVAVSKTVEGADSAAVADVEYTFQLLNSSNQPVANASYTIGGSQKETDSDGTFTLKANQTALFGNLDSYNNYTVKELNPSDVPVAGYDYVSTTANGSDSTQATVTVQPDEVVNVAFVNKYEDSDPVPGGGDRQPTYEKQANINGDGNYDLSLSVSGKVDSTQTTQMLDVIFVLDESGSMKRAMDNDNNHEAAEGSRRRDKASAAINSLVNALAADKGFDARFALVTFAGGKDYYPYSGTQYKFDDANILQGWTETASDITNKTSPSSDGGTNYEAGLMKAVELLNQKRKDATTAIIFVSDGNPTFYYDDVGNTEGEGNADSDGECLQHAKDLAATLKTDYFFTVGVGPSGNYQKLKDLKDAAILVPEANRKFYEGSSETALNNAFDDIRGSLTSIALSDVRIEDTLSNYVDAVTTVDDVPDSLQIKVTKANGIVVQQEANAASVQLNLPKSDLNAAATLTATYDAQTKQVVLDFPKEYQLENNWVYEVIIEIAPNHTAETAYVNNDYAYPDGMTGDPGTGTHANDPGFESNVEGSAKVYYTSEGKKYYNEYDMPVVQLDLQRLTIVKNVVGDVELPDSFEIQVKDSSDQIVETLTIDEEPVPTGNNPYTWTLDLPEGDYTVLESGADIEDYILTATVKEDDGDDEDLAAAGYTVSLDADKTVTITNSYAPANGDLLISKTLTGINATMGEDVTFIFKIEGPDGPDKQTYYRYLTFSKSDFTTGESVTKEVWLRDVPVGQYTVTELDAAGYTCKDGNEKTAAVDSTEVTTAQVSFTNSPANEDPTPGDQNFVENAFNWDVKAQKWVWVPATENGNEAK